RARHRSCRHGSSRPWEHRQTSWSHGSASKTGMKWSLGTAGSWRCPRVPCRPPARRNASRRSENHRFPAIVRICPSTAMERATRARSQESRIAMRMILVLSFGGSLRRWREHGILSREIEIYLRYLGEGLIERLYVFSYAHDDDVGLIDAPPSLLRRIQLIRPSRPLRTRLSRLLYSIDPRCLQAIRAEGIEV